MQWGIRPIYKHKHQNNSYAMGLIPIIVKVKIQDITFQHSPQDFHPQCAAFSKWQYSYSLYNNVHGI